MEMLRARKISGRPNTQCITNSSSLSLGFPLCIFYVYFCNETLLCAAFSALAVISGQNKFSMLFTSFYRKK